MTFLIIVFLFTLPLIGVLSVPELAPTASPSLRLVEDTILIFLTVVFFVTYELTVLVGLPSPATLPGTVLASSTSREPSLAGISLAL